MSHDQDPTIAPLAFGVLAAKESPTLRSQNTQWRKTKEDEDTISLLKQLAQKYKATPSVIALAWMYSKPEITSPIVGINKEQYLDDALAATALKLDKEDIKALEKPYRPRAVVGKYTSCCQLCVVEDAALKAYDVSGCVFWGRCGLHFRAGGIFGVVCTCFAVLMPFYAMTRALVTDVWSRLISVMRTVLV